MWCAAGRPITVPAPKLTATTNAAVMILRIGLSSLSAPQVGQVAGPTRAGPASSRT